MVGGAEVDAAPWHRRRQVVVDIVMCCTALLFVLIGVLLQLLQKDVSASRLAARPRIAHTGGWARWLLL